MYGTYIFTTQGIKVLIVLYLLPVCRLNFTTVSSYSAGANVSIVANDLSSDTEYVFACYASSVVGNGERSRQIRVRTGELLYLKVQLCDRI